MKLTFRQDFLLSFFFYLSYNRKDGKNIMTKKALSDKQIDRIEKFANSMVWFCVGSYVTAILYEAVIRVNDKK